MMVLAIDFDGVIHNNKKPVEGRHMGAPHDGAKEALLGFRKRGDEVIVFSVRGNNPKHIADWMSFYGIPYSRITDVKPVADFYVDDRAIHHVTWENTLREITARVDTCYN